MTPDDEATVRAALEKAEVAALLPALAWATGDLSLLRDDLCTDSALSLLPGTGLTDEQLAEARQLAFEALARYRAAGGDGGPLVPPSEDDLRRMIAFAVGGAAVDDRYLPLFEEELGAGDADLRAPDWTLDELAPGAGLSVVIIGAGMSGLLAAHRLDQAGVPFVVVEKNDDVGGTWLENSYPGCRVDVPNHFYSYSCAQRDDWPQHYSTQPVLLEYFRSCAERWSVRDRIRFGTEVVSATWSDETNRWSVVVRPAGAAEDDSTGALETLEASAVISAVGQLNRPRWPDLAGMDRFGGPWFHTAAWDHDVDLTGKRVAVIGTGASAMQVIPAIADDVAALTVFQRTPAWLVPTPEYYEDVSPEEHWLLRNVPGYGHWHRFWLFWRNAEGMLPLVTVEEGYEPKDEAVSTLNELLRGFLAAYLEAEFGDRPDLLDAVVPHYPPAAKRVIRDDGTWARTLKRDDVSLVTEKISEVTATGVRTADGVDHEVDVIVYGTGFEASRFLTPMQVVGRHGVDLHERWHGDARAYLGMTVPGFPNLFLLYGPNTNIVINGSIIFFSECEVRYVLGCLRLLAAQGAAALDVRPEVHDAYNELIDAGNRNMAWGVATVNSWYRNEYGRSAQNWPFTLLEYWQRTLAPDPADYELTDARGGGGT